MKFSGRPNINFIWSSLIVEELIRCGADYFCLAPGSRSSPLAVAVGENKKAAHVIHYDERGLAFHATGYVQASKKPASIITTSGTAVANLLPAVIEASKKKIPLILLTADRPPELRRTGANQTIDQPGIFKNYVRFEFDMPCPTEDIKPSFVLTTIDQAVYLSMYGMPGPVHINCMFREPLSPSKNRGNIKGYMDGLAAWSKSDKPYTVYASKKHALSREDYDLAAKEINGIKNGLIVCGKLSGDSERQAVMDLSDALKWPVIADITSGLRNRFYSGGVIHHFDAILSSDKVLKKFSFDGIVHLGGRVTSAEWYKFVERVKPSKYIMAVNHPLRNDPAHIVTMRLETDILSFCDNVRRSIRKRSAGAALKNFTKYSADMSRELDMALGKSSALTQQCVARAISENIPDNSGLFLSNSLPVREMDMFASAKGNKVFIGSSRGASGIDGIIAAACGFTEGLGKICTLLVGDLAFLHDINSLFMVKSLKNPLIIVVINNNGGGIFSFLPIRSWGEPRGHSHREFDKFFGAPHDLFFYNTSRMFGIEYENPKNPRDFINVYNKSLKSGKSVIIEIKTDREENRRFQKTLIEKLSRVIK